MMNGVTPAMNKVVCGKRNSGVSGNAGFTLMEVMAALAIFMIVMGATAQGLINSFSVIRLQEERTSALNDCRAVLSTMRHVAYTMPASDACPEGSFMFPCVLINWVNNFPETFEDAQHDQSLLDTYGGFFSLRDQTFIIELTDRNGNAPTIHDTQFQLNSNPVYVRVTTMWHGVRGHVFSLDMHSVLTNR